MTIKRRTLDNALRRIASDEPHRFAWETYEALSKGGYAEFSGGRWTLTERGRSTLEERPERKTTDH